MRSVVCAIAVVVAAVPVSACGPEFVRELDVKNANMTVPDGGDAFGVIQSPDDLAKSKFFTDDAGRDAIKKQIDFAKEKIVVVSWWDSSTSWVVTRVSKDGKTIRFEIATGNPALADLRPHIHLFAVPKDVAVETAPGRVFDSTKVRHPMEVVELPLKDVKIVHDRNEVPPRAIVIASADDLAKSGLFADDAGRDAIAKQIDFAKQKLVLFVWSGSGGDKIGAGVRRDGASRAAIFTYTRGETDDLRDHALAFAVPKDYEVKAVKE
jgi:hypothetical protein